MVIFNSYVKLPEGTQIQEPWIARCCTLMLAWPRRGSTPLTSSTATRSRSLQWRLMMFESHFPLKHVDFRWFQCEKMDFRWILYDFSVTVWLQIYLFGPYEKYFMALSYILVAPEQKLTKVDVESPPCTSWLRCRNGKITTIPGGVPQFQIPSWYLYIGTYCIFKTPTTPLSTIDHSSSSYI